MSTSEILLGFVVTLLFVAGIILLMVAVRQHRRARKAWDWHR
jgi:hypothetical protein